MLILLGITYRNHKYKYLENIIPTYYFWGIRRWVGVF